MWLLELPILGSGLGFGQGDVIHVSAHGGFFVEVVHVKPILTLRADCAYRWSVLARPLLGRTMAEKLSKLYEEALSAKGIDEVEAALHVAEFASRAMRITREVEESVKAEGVVSTICHIVQEAD